MEYPNDYSAEYIFHNFDKGGFVELYFVDFVLAPLSSLKVFDNTTKIAVYRGEAVFRPPILRSAGSVMRISFNANGQNSAPGFKIKYTFMSYYYEDYEIQKPATDCGGIRDDYGGVITVSGKETRPNKYDCIWVISPPLFTSPSTFFSISVAHFNNIRPGSVVEIRKGLSSESALLKKIKLNIDASPKEVISPAYPGMFVRLRVPLYRTSKIILTYAAFKYTDCIVSQEFRCNNSRCISINLRCDGFDQCGDSSDEWFCAGVYIEKSTSSVAPIENNDLPAFPKAQKLLSPGATNLILVMGVAGLGLFATTTIMILRRLCKQRTRLPPDEPTEPLYTVSADVDTEESDDGQIFELTDGNDDRHLDSCDPPAYDPPPSYDEVMKQHSTSFTGNSNRENSQPQSTSSGLEQRNEVFSVLGLVKNWKKITQSSVCESHQPSLQTFAQNSHKKSPRCAKSVSNSQTSLGCISHSVFPSNHMLFVDVLDTQEQSLPLANEVPITHSRFFSEGPYDFQITVRGCRCRGACSCLSENS